MSEIVERLSKEVHNSWWEEKRKQGFIDWHTKECPKCGNALQTVNEKVIDVMICIHCDFSAKRHTDMIHYSELAENIKEYDRVTVRTVLKALNNQGYSFKL